MPFKSKAQRRLFWRKVDAGEISRAVAEEWERATPDIDALPEHIAKTGAAVLNTTSYNLGKKAALQSLGIAKTAEPAGKKVEVGSRKGGASQPMPGKRGHRFSKMVTKLEHQKGVRDPKALAGAIARSKYGTTVI